MMSETVKRLNVAWATNGGKRLVVRSKSVHRITARIRSAGSRTGSRCSMAKNADEARAEKAKDTFFMTPPTLLDSPDRKSDVKGKSVDLGGRRTIKKTTTSRKRASDHSDRRMC